MKTQSIAGGLREKGRFKETSLAKPLITVITVVLNGERYLEQTILSVLRQSYDNVEYLIIDGGSTDGTLEIIKRYDGEIDYWISEPDSGIYEAMNKGIAVARGELIGLLNSDDYYEPQALQVVAAASVASPAAGIFYGNSYILQEDMGLRYKTYGHTHFWRGMGFPHQAMFVRHAVHGAIGTYDTAYRIAADYDFLLRAMEGYIILLYVDKLLVCYRNTGLSGSNLYATLNEIRKINRKHFGLLSLAHVRFLLLFAKSCLLLALEKVVGLLCGLRVLACARKIYMKKIIIKGDTRR